MEASWQADKVQFAEITDCTSFFQLTGCSLLHVRSGTAWSFTQPNRISEKRARKRMNRMRANYQPIVKGVLSSYYYFRLTASNGTAPI